MKAFLMLAVLSASLFAEGAQADDCGVRAQKYEDACPSAPVDENGLSPVICDIEKAKKNFNWASKLDASAANRFRYTFDNCASDGGTYDIADKNIYAAILSQTHNMDALCSIKNCEDSGDIYEFLGEELALGHLYKGKSATPAPAATPDKPKFECGGYFECSH